MATSVFAALTKDATSRRKVTLADALQMEGQPYSNHYTLEAGTIGTPPTGTIANLAMPSLGRAWWVENLCISSNKSLVLNVSWGFLQTNVSQLTRVQIAANSPVVIPVRTLLRPFHAAVGSFNVAPISVRASTDTLTSGVNLYVVANGTDIYDDLNFGADKIGLVIGDSICNDTTGINSKMESMEWKVRDYFQAQGNNIRFINKSVSGSTTSDHERHRAHGEYDFPQVDYIHYQLGTNDGGSGVSSTTHGTNVAAAIAWKQRLYPKAVMVVYGSTPLADNTAEATLATMRSAGQAAVTSANDPKVKWCSLATSFDRAVSTNFAEAAGSGVHPKTAAHAAAASTMTSFLAAQGITTL